MKDLELLVAARRVVAKFRTWQQHDELFPDPEYDELMDAIEALALITDEEEKP